MGIFDAKEVHIFWIFRYFLLDTINVYNAGDSVHPNKNEIIR